MWSRNCIVELRYVRSLSTLVIREFTADSGLPRSFPPTNKPGFDPDPRNVCSTINRDGKPYSSRRAIATFGENDSIESVSSIFLPFQRYFSSKYFLHQSRTFFSPHNLLRFIASSLRAARYVLSSWTRKRYLRSRLNNWPLYSFRSLFIWTKIYLLLYKSGI